VSLICHALSGITPVSYLISKLHCLIFTVVVYWDAGIYLLAVHGFGAYGGPKLVVPHSRDVDNTDRHQVAAAILHKTMFA